MTSIFRQWKALAIALAMGVAMSAAAPSQADPVSFLPSNAVVFFNSTDLEVRIRPPAGFTGLCSGFVACGSQTLSGIFHVVTLSERGEFGQIEPPGSSVPVYWSTGRSDGTQLNGTVNGLQVSQIIGTPFVFDMFFTGGSETLYNVPNGSYQPTIPPASNTQVCGAPTCPAPWLSLNFVQGVIAGDDPATVFDETTTTFFAHSLRVNAVNINGVGNLAVIGGTAQTRFDTNFVSSPELQECGGMGVFAILCNSAGSWPVAGFDVASARTVPDPGSLALIFAGLAALVAGARRKAGAV